MGKKCEYCGCTTGENDVKCPGCGAEIIKESNPSRTNPKTIEELKKWYNNRGLPPSDVTRFYIGENVKGPKAFGIYRDNYEYVVYKNKASGERVERYRGTDEAYAVNELFMKLKEEIASRKLNKSSSSEKKDKGTPLKGSEYLNPKKVMDKAGNSGLAGCLGCLFWMVVLAVAPLIIIGILIFLYDQFFSTSPKDGYYLYNDTVYYKTYKNWYEEANVTWFEYDSQTDEWLFPVSVYSMPESLQQRETAKEYWLKDKWNDGIGCTDFRNSVFYRDLNTVFYKDSGYYRYEDDIYYHLSGLCNIQWYTFDTEWKAYNFDSLPVEMQHVSLLDEYKTSLDKLSSYNITDFEKSVFYRDYTFSGTVDSGYYSYDDVYYYHLGSDYEEYWYYYDDNSWRMTSFSSIPEDMQHCSLISDYYYSSGFNDSEKFTDFEDTAFYSNYISSHEKTNDNSWQDWDDDSYDWDDDDSWDYDDSDWDSDW